MKTGHHRGGSASSWCRGCCLEPGVWVGRSPLRQGRRVFLSGPWTLWLFSWGQDGPRNRWLPRDYFEHLCKLVLAGSPAPPDGWAGHVCRKQVARPGRLSGRSGTGFLGV